MKLAEIFSQLTHGELAQINLGGGEPGQIAPTNYKRVISHVNLGLTALHKRFCLKESRLTLSLQTGVTEYPLKNIYAVNNTASNVLVRTILDTPQAPFSNDILKVERVYTDSGFELGLNNHSDVYSLYTPSFNILRVPVGMVTDSIEIPEIYKTDTLEVVYRANHYNINEDTGLDDPDDTEVEIPDSHLEALLYFIASRVHNPIGLDNTFHQGNNFAAKYEAECQRLEQVNLNVDQGSQSDRLYRNGWI